MILTGDDAFLPFLFGICLHLFAYRELGSGREPPSCRNVEGVIHRVGGLEDPQHSHRTVIHVIHRVGGLEAGVAIRLLPFHVIHRVGGLEVIRILYGVGRKVIHRVGGLEGNSRVIS